MYHNGQGVRNDLVLSNMRVNIAASRYTTSEAKKRERAKKVRDDLASNMNRSRPKRPEIPPVPGGPDRSPERRGRPRMKKLPFFAIVLLALLPVSAAGSDARISWTLPDKYSDGTPIPEEDIRKIVVQVYSGPARGGPWRWIATAEPGGTSAIVLTPAPLETLWYTVKATLRGGESDYAVPVSKTNLSIPIIPGMKKILKKMISMKRWIFLFLLIFLAGLAGYVRYRGRKAKG